ncbi:MAG: radical SAM protein [Polyangiaceae bacterium]|nr:radical SAM protein [Polyangiaceae bacterium]
MRIALVYPPPWKIPRPGEPPDTVDGPPPGYREGDLDADFWQTPYGLYSLGAQAQRAGHQVKVLNLSSYDWPRAEAVLAALDADLYGFSCWTANRRGVALAAAAVKRHRPRAHVVVGGPHATPLARELLAHHSAIDTVTLGESEDQFLEVVGRLAREAPPTGVAGTMYREGGVIVEGPPRAAIEPLDRLASPHDEYPTHIVMTSRGCPWQCTFCGAEATWGRGFRSFSEARVLDMLEATLRRLPVRMIQIKDDTFTTDKKRVVSLCRSIRERGLRFAWSCDTRVDVLSDELVREMRLAGCQRLSLGVESGSPRVLANIDKRITIEKIRAGTELARSVGLQVRYYMMLGNRGETAETFRETLAFLEQARPHQYIFSCLSIYPGTRDAADAEAAGWLEREVFFRERFQELKVPFDASPEDVQLMNDWFFAHQGVRNLYRPSLADTTAVLERLGDHAPAHLDVANAAYDAGELDLAERHARRALALAHPLPGLVHNTLGCVAFARGDVEGMQAELLVAARQDPQHPALIRNAQAARRWFAAGGPTRGKPLELVAEQGFQLLERTLQPALPGPLPEDFASWDPLAQDPSRAHSSSRPGGSL